MMTNGIQSEAGGIHWLANQMTEHQITSQSKTLSDLYGEAVGHNHDDQWDEESHEGANQHEALLVQNTAAVDKHLVFVVKADHRDRHGHTYRRDG